MLADPNRPGSANAVRNATEAAIADHISRLRQSLGEPEVTRAQIDTAISLLNLAMERWDPPPTDTLTGPANGLIEDIIERTADSGSAIRLDEDLMRFLSVAQRWIGLNIRRTGWG